LTNISATFAHCQRKAISARTSPFTSPSTFLLLNPGFLWNLWFTLAIAEKLSVLRLVSSVLWL
jgi:hypothetical protein